MDGHRQGTHRVGLPRRPRPHRARLQVDVSLPVARYQRDDILRAFFASRVGHQRFRGYRAAREPGWVSCAVAGE